MNHASFALILGIASLVLLMAGDTPPAPAGNPVEVGAVRWGRNLEVALETSKTTGRPVFLLFQEVPGCSGCQTFGRTVLTHPLLVEAIEDEFVPVLVHNNTGGEDAKILARFKEPAWNYQVIRFLDANAEDLIPRKDRVWTTGALARRMADSLRAAERPVPKYLEAIVSEHDTTHHATTAFAMHCFWTGEYQLGSIAGVVSTEAGWIDGREVTRVVYDRTKITLESLTAKARSVRCAEKVYPATGNGELTGYRRARGSDQKKQVESWAALRSVPGVTDVQRTKINALAPASRAKAVEWLSPRQRVALNAAEVREAE